MVKKTYRRTNRVRDNIERALRALGEPSTYPTISNWLYDNVPRWHKHAPTSGAIGAILNTDHRFVKTGRVNITRGRTAGGAGTRGNYNLWALKEWQ
jgi:hypothetical protein